MKTIELANGQEAIVDDEDYEGVSKFKWRVNDKGYATRAKLTKRPDGTWLCSKEYLHRFVIQAPKGQFVDHIDENPLNNQKSNLRLCTRQQNYRNQSKPQRNSKSGFRGVSKQGKWWRAAISVDGESRYLGLFDAPEEAFEAYKKASVELAREFSPWNG